MSTPPPIIRLTGNPNVAAAMMYGIHRARPGARGGSFRMAKSINVPSMTIVEAPLLKTSTPQNIAAECTGGPLWFWLRLQANG
jgi:hypothetical protein